MKRSLLVFLKKIVHQGRAVLPLLLVGTCAMLLSGCTWFTPLPAALQVISSDVSATVFLDGQVLDKTPYINQNLKEGEYFIQIQPDDPKFVTYSTKVTLRSGIMTVVAWKPGLTPETSGGVVYEAERVLGLSGTKLSIVTIPDGGILEVNGQPRGFAPLTFEDLLPGEHQYKISLPSYQTQEHSIHLTSGYHMHVTVQLAKETTSDAASQQEQNGEPLLGNAVSTDTDNEKKKMVKILPTGFRREGREGLRVREEPSNQAREIDFVQTGDEFPLLETSADGKWNLIKVELGEGWVSGTFSQVVE